MLSNPKDVVQASSTAFRDMTSDGSYFYVVTSQPRFKKLDIDSLEQVNTDLTILTAAACISLVSSATAVIGSSSTSSVDFVDINTYARTTVSTGAGAVNRATQGQQMAGYPGTGVVFSTRNTNGTIQKIQSNQTVSQLTPSEITGNRVICLTVTGASGTWLMGTDAGKVHEFNSSGTVLKTITLPTDNFVNTPAIQVTGLSFYDNRLLVLTNHGVTYLYNYADDSIIERGFGFIENDSNLASALCHSSSGSCLTSTADSVSTSSSTQEIFFKNQIMVEDEFLHISNVSWYGNHIDSTAKKAAVNSSNSSSFDSLRILDISPTDIVNVATKAQNPAGNDVSARIIRLRDSCIGRASVYSDDNISAASTDLPATSGRNYIELAIIDDGGSKFDIREFKA